MNWKIVIAALIAIVIIGQDVYESYNYIVGDSSEIKLNVSSETEKLAIKEGISILSQEDMKTDDGFFRSSGKIIIRSENSSGYVATVKNAGLTGAFYF
jgi:hypothetical protein